MEEVERPRMVGIEGPQMSMSIMAVCREGQGGEARKERRVEQIQLAVSLM
jgi:hypothetical protein